MQLRRIRSATVATPCVDATASALSALLEYRIRDRSPVTSELAALWRAPAMAGRGCIVLSTDEYPDVSLRLVEVSPLSSYRPFWSFGWNSFEISVAGLDELFRRLRDEKSSFFSIRGEPHALRAPKRLHNLLRQAPPLRARRRTRCLPPGARPGGGRVAGVADH